MTHIFIDQSVHGKPLSGGQTPSSLVAFTSEAGQSTLKMIESLTNQTTASGMYRGHWRLLIFLSLLIIAALAVAQVATRSNYLYTSDNGMKLLQVINLTSSKPSIDLAYPGQRLVENPQFAPFVGGHAVLRNGHWYSVFPLPYAILDAPFYRLLGTEGLYVIPGLSLIAIGALTYLIASLYLDKRYAFVAALLTALGTPLFFYGLINWEHAMATALATAAVLFLGSGLRRGHAIRIVASGSLVGLACWIRPESYVFLAAAALSLAVFARQNRVRIVLQFMTGAILAISPLVVFNILAYGNPLGPQIAYNYGHLSVSGAATYWIEARLSIAGSFFPITSKRWLVTYALIVGAVVLSRLVPTPKHPAYLLAGIETSAFIAVILTVAYLRSRWGISNFVEASPWMVLVPWVLVSPSKNRWPSQACVVGMLLLCTVFTVLVVLLSPVSGGHQWGGRLFLLVAPIWAILGVLAYSDFHTYSRTLSVERNPSSVHRFLLPVAFYALLISSLAIQIVSVEKLSSAKQSWELLADPLAELPREAVIVSNSWWIPLVLAPDFYDHDILHVSSDDDFCQLLHTLVQEGVPSVSLISTPEILDTPSGACATESASLKEISRETIPLWTPVVIQNYAVLPAGLQD